MAAVPGGLLAIPFAAEAQPTRKTIPRIAFLTTTSPVIGLVAGVGFEPTTFGL